MGGDAEPRAEIVQFLQQAEAFLCDLGEYFLRGDQQIGIGLYVAAAHAPTQLIKLGEPEMIGMVDDDGIGAGDIQPRFDDGGGQQYVHFALYERQHDGLKLILGHPPVGDGHLHPRQQGGEIVAERMNGFDPVVNHE